MCRDANVGANSSDQQVHGSSSQEPEIEFHRGQKIHARDESQTLLKDATQEPNLPSQAANQLPAIGDCYGRDMLLAIGNSITIALADSGRNSVGFTTMPRAQIEPMKPDPRLDDESLIAALEGRLSRESGADAKNWETFGAECIAGWSFAEAQEANAGLAKLATQAKLRADAPCFEVPRGLRAEASSFQPAAFQPSMAVLNGNFLSTTAAPINAAVAAVSIDALSNLGHSTPSSNFQGGSVLRSEAECFKPGTACAFECYSTDEGSSFELSETEDLPPTANWGGLSTVPARPACSVIAQLGLA